MLSRPVRTAVALGLLVFATALFLTALGPLHNLWADYQDSPDSTYLLFGLPLVVAGLICLAGAARLFRGR